MPKSKAIRCWLTGLLFAVVARAESLRVATYNIENYGVADRVTQAGFRRDYPKPESEKAALRAVVAKLNADVLILQEVGPKPYLDELQRDLAKEGLHYPFAALVESADADRHVAMLSRIRPTAVTPHVDLDFKYLGGRERVKRGALEVHFRIRQTDLAIWGVHLKSRYTDQPEDPSSEQRRTGEAVAIRDAILATNPDPSRVNLLVAGDFNDFKASHALRLFQRRGKAAVASILPVADSRGETWTHAFRRDDSYSRVDHVLISAVLAKFVRGGSGVICDDPATLLASDHRPIVVTLDFPDK
ncbi:endonuclease/exonuclease/phosphatase family protein [Horticoccus luteus]|uniref:Endonuclease/exonuclease/phosphatase family protein n=1 Tax=Horticoccus luteus TaxID=2862869 RepID=A0A8F9XHR0_9BACT|nr:endonuclease/exonuclease/phosphatase family protein [Horticoccus luteus]QYM80512.1 endonuclease/exonuclease/phosphatase family protein [Horticoccus luteus]